MSILRLFSPSDPELVEKTLSRLAEQDTWNDLFSTKLIELLDKFDQIKREIRDQLRKADDRIRTAKSVEKAESFLREQVARADDLKIILAHAEHVMNALHGEFLTARDQYRGAETLRDESQKLIAEAQSQFVEAQSLLDHAKDRYQKAAELAAFAQDACQQSTKKSEESSEAFQNAAERLRIAKTDLESAARSLEVAEFDQQQACASAAKAKLVSEQAAAKFEDAWQRANLAKELAEIAGKQYNSARDSFDSARDKHLSAARLARLSTRCAIFGVALSWIAMLWTWYFVVRSISLSWAVMGSSAFIVLAAILAIRGFRNDY